MFGLLLHGDPVEHFLALDDLEIDRDASLGLEGLEDLIDEECLF